MEVTLKAGVLDPQGEAVRHALGALGFEGVGEVRLAGGLGRVRDDGRRVRLAGAQHRGGRGFGRLGRRLREHDRLGLGGDPLALDGRQNSLDAVHGGFLCLSVNEMTPWQRL